MDQSTDIDLDNFAASYEDYENEHYESDPIHTAIDDDSFEEVVDPTILITKATSPITAETMEYVHALPSYPNSSAAGYAYTVDLRFAKQKPEDVEVGVLLLDRLSIN